MVNHQEVAVVPRRPWIKRKLKPKIVVNIETTRGK
jgi:hypothetical protein